MASRMQNFVFNRNGGQPVHNIAKPSTQATREVTALAAKIRTEEKDVLRKSRSLFSTDVESIGNSTTSSFLNEPKDENDLSSNGGSNIESNEDEDVGTDDEANRTRRLGQLRTSLIGSPARTVRSEQEDYSYRQPVDDKQGHSPVRDQKVKTLKPTLDSTSIKSDESWQLPKRSRNESKRLLARRSTKAETPTKGNRHYSEETISPDSNRLAEVIPDSQIHSTEIRSRNVNGFAESELGSDRTVDFHQDPAKASYNYRKRDLDLDYSEEDLRKMPFQELASEDFDSCPQGSDSNPLNSTPSISVQEQLNHVWSSAGSEGERTQQVTNLFSSMKIQDYEDAGDDILEQFQGILTRFRQLRREKRATAVEFEKEIESRDRAVKERKDALDEDLARFKKQGHDVLQGTNSHELA